MAKENSRKPITMEDKQLFTMVAKTMAGLENVLAEELTALGAHNVEPLFRAVSFEGDKAIMYKANYCCRTALRRLFSFWYGGWLKGEKAPLRLPSASPSLP